MLSPVHDIVLRQHNYTKWQRFLSKSNTSFENMLYAKGPNSDPCAAPFFSTNIHLLVELLSFTRCCLL